MPFYRQIAVLVFRIPSIARTLRSVGYCLSLALTVGMVAPKRGAAQTCHPLAVEHAPARFRATLGLQFATYDVAGERGDYEGLYAGFAYRHRWFGLEAVLPAYRLGRDTSTEYGLGDVIVTARGTALSLREGAISLGLELPVMAPTGSADRQLGMGHAMLMPALWFALVEEPFALRTQLGYGRVFGEISDHAHHGGPGVGRTPLVNPMNRKELEHALALSLGVQRHIALQARWFGAVAIGEGVTRQILGAGAIARLDPFELLVEVQVPVAGDPFVAKLVTQLALLF